MISVDPGTFAHVEIILQCCVNGPDVYSLRRYLISTMTAWPLQQTDTVMYFLRLSLKLCEYITKRYIEISFDNSNPISLISNS